MFTFWPVLACQWETSNRQHGSLRSATRFWRWPMTRPADFCAQYVCITCIFVMVQDLMLAVRVSSDSFWTSRALRFRLSKNFKAADSYSYCRYLWSVFQFPQDVSQRNSSIFHAFGFWPSCWLASSGPQQHWLRLWALMLRSRNPGCPSCTVWRHEKFWMSARPCAWQVLRAFFVLRRQREHTHFSG